MMGYGNYSSSNPHSGNPHDDRRSDIKQTIAGMEKKKKKNKSGGTVGGDMAGSPLVDGSKVQTFA